MGGITRFTLLPLIVVLGCNNTHGDPVGTPVAEIEATSVSGVAPLFVDFNGHGSHWEEGIGAEPFYRWSFGDGAEAEGPVVQHTYLQPGFYEACLTFGVAGDQTLADTACVTIAVQ